jgi:hypothetical protein
LVCAPLPLVENRRQCSLLAYKTDYTQSA